MLTDISSGVSSMPSSQKLISVVTASHNEEKNLENLYESVKAIFSKLPQYRYEHLFIDNASTDNSQTILKQLAQADKNVKVIFNTRNFGHIRSPFHGIIQARGEAVISLVADFQDPPEMMIDFLQKWEEGCTIVIGVKNKSEESRLMFTIRKIYYHLINRLSETPLVKNYTGFGLYDQKVIQVLRQIDDPYPYFRGLIFELGFDFYPIFYTQRSRKRGISKNNFYSLFDMAMLGITNHSKIPLRLATMLGFVGSILCVLMAVVYFILKLIWWEKFTLGLAPILIGFLLFSSVQLFFIGILGEYIGAIHTQVLKRPRVIESARINFDATN